MKWSELRCPACVGLGFYSSRLLFQIEGDVPETEAKIKIKCWMCHSVISWQIGTVNIQVIEHGRRNHKRQTAAFE
jgi:hypothetical protein